MSLYDQDEIINLNNIIICKDVIIPRLQDGNVNFNSNLIKEKFNQLETEENSMHQHGRHKNIEITGIPDSTTHENLKSTVNEIFT